MRFLRTICAILLVGCVTSSWAQGYPSKTIRFIVPWPPGGNADVLVRILGPKLAYALGQQVIIDNRGGAAGNIGAELAAKSSADGYTILFAYSGTHSINRSIYRKMLFQETDFVPIIWLSEVPQVLVVHPSLPVTNVNELIALAKSKPGELTYGSSGSGAINHLAGELFKLMTGTNVVHVPYKGGGPVAIGLLSGEVGVLFAGPATVVQHVNAGKLRALAVTTAKRSLTMPHLRTFAESGMPGYEVTSWNGVLAPTGISKDITTRLNAELNRIVAASDVREQMIHSGNEPVGGEPDRFRELIQSETAKWAKVVKATGMRVD